MVRRRLVLLVAGVVVLAGCRSSGSTTAAPRPTLGTRTTTDAPTSTSPPTTAASATSTTSAGAPRCHTSQLQARIDSNQGAAGTIFVTVGLVNRSSSACTLRGFPGIGLVDGVGHLLDDPVRDPRLPATASTALVALAPAQAAQFVLAFSDVQRDSTPCPTATKLVVTPPDETDSLPLSPDSPGFLVCGSARVGPVTVPS